MADREHMGSGWRYVRVVSWGLAYLAGLLGPASPGLAGGGPENAVLIVNPTDPDSLYVGNYYKHARHLPDRNILYMDPYAGSYGAFVQYQRDALRGTLAQRRIDDRIDYVILTPGTDYRVPAQGLVYDFCAPVNHLAISTVYATTYIAEDLLAGTGSTQQNEFFEGTDQARAFDGGTAWLDGAPCDDTLGKRYLIGALLGYSGPRGNTIEETLTMIDRSVAADGTGPAGTFYFMRTTDWARSAPRHFEFPAAIDAIEALGGQAEQIEAVLPIGRHDALGIMTGWAGPNILGADMTIQPGAFCDHLTSFAGHFDTPSQTKMSDWITKGASGTAGTVEEPCNYPGKFPHPRMHVYYDQGVTLGEAVFRSVHYVPFQLLLYGDPLTRPFADIPSVSVPDAPKGEVSGVIFLTPHATTDSSDFAVSHFDLLVDGAFHSTACGASPFSLDTTTLSDGWHELRVIAYEDSPVATEGHWIGPIRVNNQGRFVDLAVVPTTGHLATSFACDVAADGDDVVEIRLRQNGRVLAAGPGPAASFDVFGRTLGAGPVELTAEAEFADGSTVASVPVSVQVTNIDPETPPAGQAPVAYDYRARIPSEAPMLLDLPAYDADGDELSYIVDVPPAQAAIQTPAGPPTNPSILLRPDHGATGSDSLVYHVYDGQHAGNPATVTIHYGPGVCEPVQIIEQPADRNFCSGSPVQLSIAATGTGPLRFQWRRDGSILPCATSPILELDPGAGDVEGLYRCVVRNDCGQVLSEPAAVSLADPPNPTITADPGPLVCTGDTILLNAGGPYDQYLWSTGETTQTILVDSTGTYGVTVTDFGGCEGSDEMSVSFSMPGAMINLDLDAVTAPVLRDVTVEIGNCTGVLESHVEAVPVSNVGFGRITLDELPAGAEWIRLREGHTLARTLAIQPDSCIALVFDLTGSRRLLAGDLHTAAVPKDNRVDITDFAVLVSHWGEPIDPAEGGGADLTGDGRQDIDDFNALVINFFTMGEPYPGCLQSAPTGSDGSATPSDPTDDAVVEGQDAPRGIDPTPGALAVPTRSLPHQIGRQADLNADGVVDARDIRAFADRHNLPLTPEQRAKFAAR